MRPGESGSFCHPAGQPLGNNITWENSAGENPGIHGQPAAGWGSSLIILWPGTTVAVASQGG